MALEWVIVSGVGAAIWLADRVSGGIISEYGKRVWFGGPKKLQAEVGTLKAELGEAKKELKIFADTADHLLKVEKKQEAAIAALRLENARLKDELIAARSFAASRAEGEPPARPPR